MFNTAIFRFSDQGRQSCGRTEKLAQEVESTAYERRLVTHHDLNKTFDKGHDSVEVGIGFESFEQQVEVHRLLG